MEKDVALGKLGSLKLSLVGGKAQVEVSVSEAALDGVVSAQASAMASVDAGALVDMLFAEIEAKSPAGAQVIEEAVKAVVKNAVLAIK